MAIDSTIAIRRGILIIAKANTTLVAIVPKKDIYPQTVAADHGWPFIRSGSPSVVPVRAACVDGGEWIVAMHGFAKDRKSAAGAVLETAEDFAGRIGAALAAALDGQVITLTNGRARITWTGGQLLMDPEEPGAFHTVQNFVVRAITG
jgi:hypothetical protein